MECGGPAEALARGAMRRTASPAARGLSRAAVRERAACASGRSEAMGLMERSLRSRRGCARSRPPGPPGPGRGLPPRHRPSVVVATVRAPSGRRLRGPTISQRAPWPPGAKRGLGRMPASLSREAGRAATRGGARASGREPCPATNGRRAPGDPLPTDPGRHLTAQAAQQSPSRNATRRSPLWRPPITSVVGTRGSPSR